MHFGWDTGCEGVSSSRVRDVEFFLDLASQEGLLDTQDAQSLADYTAVFQRCSVKEDVLAGDERQCGGEHAVAVTPGGNISRRRSRCHSIFQISNSSHAKNIPLRLSVFSTNVLLHTHLPQRAQVRLRVETVPSVEFLSAQVIDVHAFSSIRIVPVLRQSHRIGSHVLFCLGLAHFDVSALAEILSKM